MLLRRTLILCVAIIWGAFFGVAFPFSLQSLVLAVVLGLALAQFWD